MAWVRVVLVLDILSLARRNIAASLFRLIIGEAILLMQATPRVESSQRRGESDRAC